MKDGHGETKQSRVTLRLEKMLSFNDSFWVTLAAPIEMFIFNKTDTWSHYSIEEKDLKWGKTKKIN